MDIEILINYTALKSAMSDNRASVLVELEDAEFNARAFHEQAVWMRDHNWLNKAAKYQEASRHHAQRALAYRTAIQAVDAGEF